jgi:hypothetical protein
MKEHLNNFLYPEEILPMKTFTNQKRDGQMVAHEITPDLPIAGQKFPQYSEDVWEIFRYFKMLYLLHDLSRNHD